MQLIIIKKNFQGEICSEVSANFNDFTEYVSFLELNGIYIEPEDAIFEFSRDLVTYNLPLEV